MLSTNPTLKNTRMDWMSVPTANGLFPLAGRQSAQW